MYRYDWEVSIPTGGTAGVMNCGGWPNGSPVTRSSWLTASPGTARNRGCPGKIRRLPGVDAEKLVLIALCRLPGLGSARIGDFLDIQNACATSGC